MNDLVVKKVDLCGDVIMAAQDKDGQVWAGVRWLCDGLGLTKGQMQSERLKIQEDVVLKEGERNFVLPTKGGKQEVLCLRHDFVPLWIAKITVTPSMKENNPELVKKLVEYQLKAKDVLAEAFLPNHKAVEQGVQRIDAATLKGIANTGNLIRNTMKDEKAKPYETAMVLDSLFRQGGLVLPEQFIKIPEYEQMKLEDFMK